MRGTLKLVNILNTYYIVDYSVIQVLYIYIDLYFATLLDKNPHLELLPLFDFFVRRCNL